MHLQGAYFGIHKRGREWLSKALHNVVECAITSLTIEKRRPRWRLNKAVILACSNNGLLDGTYQIGRGLERIPPIDMRARVG